MIFQNNDAPLLIVLGQSNAYGHNTKLPPEERILTPLSNVHGLSRADHLHLHPTEVFWRGYTSFGMNLAMPESQDHTVCLPTLFARQWQQRIDSGEALPDLYIVFIGRGGQGVNEYDQADGEPLNMWWPDRPPILEQRPDGSLDLSLFPFTMDILRLVRRSLLEMGKRPVPIGVHWNQWEAEVCTGMRAVRDFPFQFQRIRQGIRKALRQDYPLFLYQPLSEIYGDPAALREMTRILENLAREVGVTLLDLRTSGLWEPHSRDHGIFQADCVHYTPQAQRWFTAQQWKAEALQKEEIP